MHGAVFAVLFLSALVALSYSRGYEEICLEELGYNNTIFNGAYGYRNKIKEGDEKINAYFDCYWKKMGYLNQDGTFNSTTFMETLHADANRLLGCQGYCTSAGIYPYTWGLLDKCKQLNETDTGDFVVKLKNCIIDEFWKVAG